MKDFSCTSTLKNQKSKNYCFTFFTKKKKSTLASKQESFSTYNSSSFFKYYENLFFQWKNCSVGFKKFFINRLIFFNHINKILCSNYSNVWLKTLEKNHNKDVRFFNIVFLFSNFLEEIVESTKSKTIYLYRIVLLANIPLIFLSINNTFILQPNKNSLSFLFPEQKRIFYRKIFIYDEIFKKEIFHNQVFKVIEKKIKQNLIKRKNAGEKELVLNTKKMSFCIFPNSFKQIDSTKLFLPSPIDSYNSKRLKVKTSIKNQSLIHPFKQYFLYKKIKKESSNHLQNEWTDINRKINPLSQTNFLSFPFFPRNFLEKSDSIFFSLIYPKQINKTDFLIKKDWILKSKDWNDIYSIQKNFISKNKNNLKQNIQSFTNLNFVFFFSENLLENLSKKVFLTIRQLPFKNFYQKEKFFYSYQNSLFCNNLTFNKSINSLRKIPSPFDYFSKSRQSIKSPNFFKTINLLYKFSSICNQYSIIFNPENLLIFSNTIPIKRFPESFCFSNKENIYDFDTYFKYSTYNDELFWIPSSSIQKNLIEKKEDEKNLLLLSSNKKNFEYQNLEKENFFLSQKEINLIRKKREKLQTIFANQKIVLRNYNKWAFTSQWWFYQKYKIFTELQILLENLNDIKEIIQYRIFNSIVQLFSKIKIQNKKVEQFEKNFLNSIQITKKFLPEEIIIDIQKQEINYWNSLKLFSSCNNKYWTLLSWFIPSSIIYYHWLPMLTGIIYFYFWLDFEKIRSLSFPSWNTFIKILVYNSFDSASQQIRLAEYASKARMTAISSTFFRKILGKSFLFRGLLNTTNVDFSRKNKNLVSNCLRTKKVLSSESYIWTINKTNEEISINGFTFFKKWSQNHSRFSYFVQKTISKSFIFQWLNDLFFYNIYSIPAFQYQSDSYLLNIHGKPKPLRESVGYVKRWLFIGGLESGKSFIIKNIATSTQYPLIHISLNDIKRITPETKYKKSKKEKRSIEQLSERSFFLENILNLAKLIAPCILWVSDLHEFYIKSQIQEKKRQTYDSSVLLASLLKILNLDLLPEQDNPIIFIGSTDYPRLLDPKFLSRHRLDLIVNFRKPSFNQRYTLLKLLLKNKGFTLKGSRSFYELGCNTIGYNFHEITTLANETLLIKVTEKNNLVDLNTIRLAISRKISTQSFKNPILRSESLQYKIGKALIQATIVYPKSVLFLNRFHNFWKTKFYYLSNSFFEISNKQTVNTEFAMLPQILNCLAGSAARDASLLYKKKYEKNALSLSSQLKHDFSIASTILQSLFVEFPMHEVISLDYKKLTKNVSKNFSFKLIKKTTLYFDLFHQYSTYINWSLKTTRLSFSWILLFSTIVHSAKNLENKGILEKNKENNLYLNSEKGIDINIPYERRETQRQQQNFQKIESLFKKMIYNIYMENMGFPWDSDYVMDYNSLQLSFFFTEGRPLWNPQTKMPSYSILFFDRDLLINQKMLTKLYMTYGNKFQNEKLNRKRIKKNSLWSNLSFNNNDFNNKIEQKKHSIDFQSSNFHFYESLMTINAQLEQSQIQLPVYLHQSWITPNSKEFFTDFNFFLRKKRMENNDLIYKESLLSETLLEIYHYLLKLFLNNKSIMIEIEDLLLINKILYRQDLEFFLKKLKKKTN
jgi:hypothetical protein